MFTQDAFFKMEKRAVTVYRVILEPEVELIFLLHALAEFIIFFSLQNNALHSIIVKAIHVKTEVVA